MILSNRNITFLAFLLLLSGCNYKDNQDCTVQYQRYTRLVARQGDKPDTAILITTLNDIISNGSTCTEAYLTRGDLFFSMGDNIKAQIDYEKVVQYDSLNVYALYKLGLVSEYEEKHKFSIYFLTKAITIKTKGNIVADYHRINRELETKEAKYDIPAADLFYNRGIAFYYGRDLSRAFNDFSFCILHEYKLGKAYLMRGAIYEEIGKKDKACEDFSNSKIYGNTEADEYLKKYCK